MFPRGPVRVLAAGGHLGRAPAPQRALRPGLALRRQGLPLGLPVHGEVREGQRGDAGDVLQVLVREALRRPPLGRAPHGARLEVPEPAPVRLEPDQRPLREVDPRHQRVRRQRQQQRQRQQPPLGRPPAPLGRPPAPLGRWWRRRQRRAPVRRQRRPPAGGGVGPDGDVRLGGPGPALPHLRVRPRHPRLPEELQLLQPLHLRALEEVREAAGDDVARGRLPDALQQGQVPRLCVHLRGAALQPPPHLAARIRWASQWQGPDLHRPHEAPGGRLRLPAGLPAGLPWVALPGRQDAHHAAAALPRPAGLPQAPCRAAPRRHGHGGHRVAGPADGGGDGEHDDIHGGHRGLHVLVGGVHGRPGGQHRQLVHHGELPGPDQRRQGGIHWLPRRVHDRGARWLRRFNCLPD
mmetsp:Transcript_47812/g.147732  ORF Transcript_47812/g.147732 Transcript_47812/m.147732 type:complete len:407 (-) Transcript_47812:532-1752(-)